MLSTLHQAREFVLCGPPSWEQRPFPPAAAAPSVPSSDSDGNGKMHGGGGGGGRNNSYYAARNGFNESGTTPHFVPM